MKEKQKYCIEATSCQLGYDAKKKIVVNNITFQVCYGEWLAIIGRNGSGKTTLLRNILGLQSLLMGELRVFNEKPQRGNSNIGYVAQLRETHSNVMLSGEQFVASAVQGWRYGLPILSRQQKQRVVDCIKQVGASDFSLKPYAELSGGQKQRLHLAQALIDSPALLLLDEPLTHLDQPSQEDFLVVLDSLQKESQMTIAMVTHALDDIKQYATQVLSLDINNE